MKLILVDDNTTFLESLKHFVEGALNHEVIASYTTAKSLLQEKVYAKADLILMDIEMPELNGIEATRKLIWKLSDLKIIAITNYQDKAYLTELIGAGFKGCIFKDQVFDQLQKAINEVNSSKIYFPKNIHFDR